MARALLLHTIRAATLLQWVKREPQLLGPNAQAEWLGISGGLISLSAWAISEDFDTLRDACLEVARLLVRLCRFTSVRSRAVEDSPGVWGWAVVGISADDLRKTLNDFQRSVGIPSIKRAQVGVTGAGWSTIIGPPSVLELFINQCPAVRRVPKNPLNIHALQHTINLSQADLDYIVGNNSDFLDRPICCPALSLWGMDEPGAIYANWGDMLRAICSQVLSRPLDITQVVGNLNTKLSGVESVRVIQIGTTSHTPYLVSALKTPGRHVSVQDGQSLLQALNGGASFSQGGRIAIVGMSGRGPGSDNVDEFWDLILSKQDLCREVPKDRFDVDEFYCPEHGHGDKRCTMTTRFGCFMDKPGNFDSRFFHISPREAMLMDPGHRQFLMSSYEALEMAGYSDGQTKATDPTRIAAFYGQVSDDWHDQSHPTLGCDAYTLQGVQRAFGPGRLAWQFKWEGPTYSIDSACASTTSSLHLACMSLMSNDIDMAVAGASNILSYPHSFTCLSKAGVLSDTGNCKTYRDDADGYCRADFVGAVVLKRLEDALAHNDNILAVVASSGRNHSGNSSSITTSDTGAQERLFRKVLRNARVSPDDISYVEMHGTGTEVGDPAEMGAVGSIFKHKRPDDGPIPVGSVKANFGHSEAAAGMASLLKCIMMFQKDTIPPQAGMPHALNPKFPPLSELNIDIPSEPKAFKKRLGSHHEPRRILLNNFDAAGGNACLLLEDYNAGSSAVHEEKGVADPRSSHVVAISARTQASHHANKRKLVEWLRTNPTARIEDVAYTTTARRMHHPYRFACTASTAQELITKLEANIEAPDAKNSSPSSSQASPIVFVFTGQGSHYAGMGSGLYRTSPAFRETVDLCVSICVEHGFPSFIDVITDSGVDMSTMTTVQTQLAVLTLEIGLAAFWKSAGVLASMVMGHSLGEYSALHVAGVLSLADVLYLVGQRALLLLERCEAGTFAMLAVSMSATDAHDFLKSRPQYSSCCVSCINSPTVTVISGSTDHVAQLRSDLTARSKTLSVSYGFHSFQMDSVLDDYSTLAEGVTFLAPKIPVASTLLGSIVDTRGTFNGLYLGQQTRQVVNFIGALNAVQLKLADPIWLELGPSQVCTSFVRATLSPSSPTNKIMSTLEGPGTDEEAWVSISKCLAAAYVQGVAIDWYALHAPYVGCLKMLTLPSYAWDMKDYWITYVQAENDQAVGLSATTAAKRQMVSTCAQYVVQESSSANKIQVTFRASLAEAGLAAIITGHRMQGLPICPGSAFCEAGFAAAAYALETNGRKEDAHVAKLALRNPTMTRPLNNNLVGSDGELFTTVVIEKPSSNDILISWKASSHSNGSPSYDLGSCVLMVCNDVESLQTDWNRTSHLIKARMDEIVRAAKDGHGHRFQHDIFYALFAPTVQYDSHYKCIKEAYVSRDFSEAVAEVVLQDGPSGTRFVASPFWGESIIHLAGFAVNANPQNHLTAAGTSFINSGFGSFEQTVVFEAGKPYFTYVRVSQNDKKTRSCDVFVIDSDNRLVARCFGLNFHQINNITLQQVLSGKSSSPRSNSPPEVLKNETSPTVLERPTESPEEEEESVTSAPTEVFGIIIQTIASETGIDASELTDDTALAELGVDSIMSIEIAARVSNATGMEMAPSFSIEHLTIGDLRRAFTMSPLSTSRAEIVSSGSRSSRGSPLKEPAVPAAAKVKEAQTTQVQLEANVDDDSSPAPNVRLTLLQGRSAKPGKDDQAPAPFYMIADGTGTIATYIHIPTFIKSKMPIYGIDSPFLHCPNRLTAKVGITGAAKLIVDALVKKQPKDIPFWIGGFSGGAMMAYEVCRQLSAAGHHVDGLLLIDMCSPRSSNVPNDDEVGLAIFDAIAGKDESGVWNVADNTHRHLKALFASVAAYNPRPLLHGERPPAKRTAIIWAQKGMIDRCIHSPQFKQILADHDITTEPYPSFMEDPKLGAVAWSLPYKASADLGPNGWDKKV
ncbi:Polyketide synthase [Tolypocladium capitatum]|uniref:Polyketide synthase n=1 Tax=Tolypocladium capitatum TaxID=45235 RepID=A0A2K3QL55_9HYPO|nr:Polyketide synthase [Tolypocladium capitatum]